MKNSKDYLEELAALDRKNGGTGSDYKLAQLLEVERQAIPRMKKRGGMDDDTALKLAELLNRNPLELIAAAAGNRTKSPVMKKKWSEVAQVAKSTAAVMLLGFSALLAAPADVSAAQSKQASNIHYAH